MAKAPAPPAKKARTRTPKKSQSPLAQLIIKLATDPATLQAFRQNPDAVMTAAGLTPAEVAIMKSKDPGAIRAALGGQPLVPGPGPQMEQFVVSDAVVIVI